MAGLVLQVQMPHVPERSTFAAYDGGTLLPGITRARLALAADPELRTLVGDGAAVGRR